MCGIAGIFHQQRTGPVLTHDLNDMIGTMSHRGPDARGVALPRAGIGLGHLRLAVLDLDHASDQPFESLDGRYALSYNGEVYNYLELRKELEGVGHRFRTDSDTEVLLASYAEWGTACVERINGMWAFLIYDNRDDTLFCSRDRFGAKPLYYAREGGRFLAASEVKALLATAPALARPNYDLLSRFFRSSAHSETEETFFRDVFRLQPAHNMMVTREGIRTWRYWDYPTDTLDYSPAEAAAAVRALLTDAVTLRMRSDVPVGTSLSSGLDSAAIAALVREQHGGPHRTFTASFPGERFDEAPRAADLAASLSMEPTVVSVVSDEVPDLLRKAVYHLDAPTQCPAVVALWNITSAMQGNVVVALDGQGADELFGGYIDRVFGHALWSLVAEGHLIRAGRDFRQHVQTWGWWTALAWSSRDLVPSSHRLYRQLRRRESVYIGPLAHGSEGVPTRRDAPRLSDHTNSVLRAQHEGGLRTLLQYGDAISMAHSIEVRMPYLDYRLVELGFRLSGCLKVWEAQGKVVLRNAVRDVVPSDILDTRRKLGFATPVARWVRDSPDEIVAPVLYSKECRARGLLDPTTVRAAVNDHASGKVDLSSQIFRWLTAELWFQQFIDS